MLCSLLKVWQTYAVVNSSFPNYGKMYTTQTDEPVAMMMSYRHREVTIVNQKDFMHCFTSEVASKNNVPVITIAPDMYKFTTIVNERDNFDHYVFYDENANIKLPAKVEERLKIDKLTKLVESPDAKVRPIVRQLIDVKRVSKPVEQSLNDMVKEIIVNERKKIKYREHHEGRSSKRLKRILKKEIRNLVKYLVRSHRDRRATGAKIKNIIELVKKSPKKGRSRVKYLIKSIIRGNAIRSITHKKIERLLSVARLYPKKAAARKIKHLVNTIIHTRTNRALTKHTIDKIVKFIRKNTGKLDEKAILKKAKRMVVNIISTTVNTIVPKSKVVEISHLAHKNNVPKKEVEYRIRNIIHDIRVDDEEDAMEDDCPICRCNLQKEFIDRSDVKKPKKVKKMRSKKVRKMKARKNKATMIKVKTVKPVKDIKVAKVAKVSKVSEQVRQIPLVRQAAIKALPSPLVNDGVVIKNGAAKHKKRKSVKSKIKRFKRVIRSVARQIHLISKRKILLKKEKDNIRSALQSVDTREKLVALKKQIKVVNRKAEVLKKKIAKLNVVKFDATQRKFNISPVGVQATKACKGLGAGGVVLKGCLQDMRMTKNPAVVLAAVKQTIATVNAVKRANIIQRRTGNAPSRTCSASGDPHFTNFNGDYFHIQQPSIYVFAKTSDGLFEVQVKQDGSRFAGDPSYVRDVMIRYDGKVYHANFNSNGFIVRSGGYVSVTVPGSYQGEMLGICGANGPSGGAVNFKLPNGQLADVSYGKHNWALGGYGGPNSKMSRWHLAWRPSMETCMFSKADCQRYLRDQNGAKNRFVRTVFGRVDMNAL
jgi:hypothetical protein